jgi:PAS domain S-box-containing protein
MIERTSFDRAVQSRELSLQEKEHRFRPGALLGYLLALLAVIGIGILALVQLGRISRTVDILTNDLAVERGLAKDIVNQVLLTRFYAHRYVRTQSQVDLDYVAKEFGRLEDLLSLADEEITDPERRAMLKRIDSAAGAYEETFEEVATLIRNRQRINAEILDIEEHVMRDKLTALRVHSVHVNDPRLFLAFGNAQNALERMRSSTLKFLVERDPKYAVQFEMAYHEAQTAFSNLETTLENPLQRQNCVEAQAAAETYYEGVDTIRSDQARLTDLLTRMEEELEPEISGVASGIAVSVEAAFDARETSSQMLIAQARSILIATSVIAVTTGLGLGLVILRRSAERQRTHQALRDSEERYRTLFQGVPVGLYRSTPTGKLLDANPSLVDMLGYPSLEQLRGAEIRNLYVNPGTYRRWSQLMEDEGIVRSFEARMLRHDDTVIWVRNTARAIAENGGGALHYEGSLEDISERKQAKAALEEARAELVRREKLAVLGKLAGGVAHELRNPLGVMSNAVYYLKMVLGGADDVTEEYLDILSEEVQNAEKIISDLLDFARIRSADTRPVNITGIVDQVLVRAETPENVEVVIRIPPELPNAVTDPQQITQVLTNQAMPEGGTMTLSAREVEGKVALSVGDTGIGMSEETMDRLFEPLFTTKAKGIGLGLAVSKYLVEANKGTIHVESEEGNGSTFTVFVPAATDSAD